MDRYGTKVTTEQYEELCIRKGLSYRQAAERLGVSSSSIQRAKKRYQRNGGSGYDYSLGDNVGGGSDCDLEIGDLREEVKRLSSELNDARDELRMAKEVNAELHGHLYRNVAIEDSDTNRFKFALISDTHYGSHYADEGAIRGFLEHCASRGITRVLHAGDVIDGEKMYRGHEREIKAHGFTPQLDYLIENFPSDLGLDVYFITGNHDMCYHKASGVDVGSIMAEAMGWTHLGDNIGELVVKCPDADYSIALMHPGGGTAYAVSYRLQKIIETWPGGQKPNLVAVGHFHKAEFLPAQRNISGIQAGTFQRQTPFMRGKPTDAHLCGQIITVNAGPVDSFWNQVSVESSVFYEPHRKRLEITQLQ